MIYCMALELCKRLIIFIQGGDKMKIYQTPSIESVGGNEENVVVNGLVAPVYAVAVAAVAVAAYGWLKMWCAPMFT